MILFVFPSTSHNFQSLTGKFTIYESSHIYFFTKKLTERKRISYAELMLNSTRIRRKKMRKNFLRYELLHIRIVEKLILHLVFVL
ncbi:hypothetical protein GS518_14245 [Leptospira interrogans]|uniref:Uncharacterized protein n=3 Tax=Leptospira interrogans TaxID=173 RepID=A0AAP9WGE6_LEPIR|nr:hypothetical protein A6J42_08240 [Leptospira interrogans serovar Copenhageni]MBE0302726.1 hypothetical protein [Leptospira interrogans serovar Yeoncheon]MCR8638856.1 hypothetical protein [Leptospira interrogans serovar Ricardi]QHH29403.1 hypothetical protein GS520_14250 [Leptospira interrogans]QOI35498.1 hypothetical protein LeptoLang_15575 [Leptospira interrogans serovar Icterohaemorrhagiae]QOI43804.1 hypothetical protein Lepto782_17145 [Leptospira interrogans serovar Canicola]QOI51773.1 